MTAKPFLKWAGGKSKSADRILELLPETRGRVYREPFLGGGAVYFRLAGRFREAYLSDANAHLMDAYYAVKHELEGLLDALAELPTDKASFLRVRSCFNEALHTDLPANLRASWLIYLNKTCFNGLYRTNQRGEFNVPYGDYEKPVVCDEPTLRAASLALQEAHVIRGSTPFEELLDTADKGDVIYLDPPYVPVSKTSNFSAYSGGGFSMREQEKLAAVYEELDRRGCLLALSQSDSPWVRDRYARFDVTELSVGRAINSKGEKRGKVTELLIRNVKRYP